MENKYLYEYSSEEKAAIRKEMAEMNKRAVELCKDVGLHPRVKDLRERTKNAATD